ncbi:hypothetical protein BDB01DRAFT_720319 [Pilobolus umbonatus]|nr:hypothetical protein BDB01DRAFT_720319 [Pilobolus umbonatus]
MRDDVSLSPSDISGPFYSISDVLNDGNSSGGNGVATATAIGKGLGRHSAETPGNNSRGARRNVNEPEIVVTSGGTSMNQLKRRSRMLPPKNPQEEKKHLQQYEKMMKKAKKLEEKKQKEVNRKKEEKDKKITHAMHAWENEIIPEWSVRANDKKTISLWDQGIPPRCRRRVWILKIGNDLNIGKNTFHDCLKRIPQSLRTPSKLTLNDPYLLGIYGDNHHYNGRPRRTSSLDVLRDRKEDTENEMYASSTNSLEGPSPYSSESETRKTYSQSEEDGSDYNGDAGRMEASDTIDIKDDDGDDSNSQADDEDMEGEEDKVIKDPVIINFLNKAIDEDILRTLPSLCVFQVNE